MWHAWERGEKCTRFWWERLEKKDHLEDRGVDGIRMDLREIGWGWSGYIWLRIGADGGLL
jgi:alpha-glucosidase (family GH31 glycosyl hydrolase)